jgi:hypothetical protein
MAEPTAESSRSIAQDLSGYLCGTHSGLLAQRQPGAPDPDAIAATHRSWIPRLNGGIPIELAQRRWLPRPEAVPMAGQLQRALANPFVIELIVFGSQARGDTSGFSDVDAVLVIKDEAADDPAALRSLRPAVLAAQRAVLAYQPMQHHGFEVATPKLLAMASEALALPHPALSEARSLNGAPIAVSIQKGAAAEPERLGQLVAAVAGLRSWPAHPWQAHRVVAMFELLPALYLQGRGASVPKWQSFDLARGEFARAWWPYDVLQEVRLAWPRMRRPGVNFAAAVGRNPWAAVAAWRRLPASLPEPIRPLLTPRLLNGLQVLARTMTERVE